MAAEDVFGIVGSVIGGAYQVQAAVGQSPVSVTYRAHHSTLQAPVRLECIRLPDGLDRARQTEFVETLRTEVERLRQLAAKVPTVVRPVGVDTITTERGAFVPLLAVEWVDGQPLDVAVQERRSSGRPYSLAELIRLLTPVAGALAQAHAWRGDGPTPLLHRELRPDSIMVSAGAGERRVRLGGHGIGSAKAALDAVAKRAGLASAAPGAFREAHAAPEQWEPDRFGPVGTATDVWGLALTLVEVLAGRPALGGEGPALRAAAIDPGRRPTPRTLGLAVSAAVEGVFAQALAVDPRQRFREVGEFYNALITALEQSASRVPSARPPSAADAMPADVIPDLDVAAVGRVRSVSDAQSPMSLMDLEELGLETEKIELDLDLADGDASSARPGIGQPRRVVSARAAELPAKTGEVGAAEAGSQRGTRGGDPAPPPATSEAMAGAGEPAPTAQLGTLRTEPPWWQRALELARDSWDEDSPLVVQLLPGIALCALALLVTVVDQIYAAAANEELFIGPLRPGWIAALFLVGGLGWIGYRVVMRYR